MKILLYISWFITIVCRKIALKYAHWYTISLCRYHGATFGSHSTFNGKSYVTLCKGAKFCVGKEFICNSGPHFSIDNLSYSKIFIAPNAELSIGDYSGISNTSIYCKHNITIGHHVNIGAGCLIMDSDFHSLHVEARENREIDVQMAKTAPITIEDGVFIGARSTITKGVRIGYGSVVAAGSVVTKDIPARQLWGGCPAKFIKSLSTRE
ncbi:MAG: acyltransferase [Prevotella sp.]|nr:acyltransferase [Prevotella sp.]